LKKHGTPRSLADLDRHLVVHSAAGPGAEGPSFEYREGDGYREKPMRSLLTVKSTDSYNAACLAGLGIRVSETISASLSRSTWRKGYARFHRR
jgi:hypothetical protein